MERDEDEKIRSKLENRRYTALNIPLTPAALYLSASLYYPAISVLSAH